MKLALPWSKTRRKSRALRRAKQAFSDPYAIPAAYDAAQTTPENRKHWAQADALSAVAAGSPSVRAIVRNRARYEVASNSLARGIVLTLANDLIGTGPRLQMQTDNARLNERIEMEFHAWAGEIGLAGKLRTMRMAKAQDGEAFAILATNERLAGLVQLDLQLIEADRVATPHYGLATTMNERAVDGIVFDEFGNPWEYHVLKHHPGSIGAGWRAASGAAGQYDSVPAANMLHWFRVDRPGQRRGLPDIMPALPLFAILRRYIKATLLSAETAAALSIIMTTNVPPEGQAAEVAAYMELALEHNMAVFAPEGWEPKQMKAEQPASTMPDFDPAFRGFIAELVRAPIGLFAEIERIHWPHAWFWPGRGHADPVKNARAADILLKAGLTTEAKYYGEQGMDWEDAQDQRQREAQGREQRGLPALLQKEESSDSDKDEDRE